MDDFFTTEWTYQFTYHVDVKLNLKLFEISTKMLAYVVKEFELHISLLLTYI